MALVRVVGSVGLVLALVFPVSTAVARVAQPHPIPTYVLTSPTATSTTLTVSPTSGDANTSFQVSAAVSPVPDGGQVELSAWSDATDGTVLWNRTFVVDGQGKVHVDGGVGLSPGTYWWQATFLGTSNFATSSSNPRKKVTVTGLPSTITNGHVQWSDPGQNIQFGGNGTSSGGGGNIELVVDGDVHAVCPTTETCNTINNLPLGPREVFLRYVSTDIDYATASTSPVTYNNGPTLPPGDGILIEGGRFSVNHRDVTINVAYGDSGHDVTGIRLSNSSAVDGSGNLTNSTNVALTTSANWGSMADWTLTSGADGTRSVFAQLQRSDTSWTSVFTDSIYVDTTPPSGSIVMDNGAPTIGDAWGASVPDQEMTGSVSDNSFGAGGSIEHMAISNGGRYFDEPFDLDPSNVDFLWNVLYNPFGPTPDGAIKTIYVKWEDEAGNWSAPATDTIRFVEDDPVAHFDVDGTPAAGAYYAVYLSNPTPTLDLTLDIVPPEGIKNVHVFGNSYSGPFLNVPWTSGQTTASIPWSLLDTTYGYSAQDGMKDVRIDITSQTNRVRTIGVTIILDRAIPLSDVPVPAFAPDSEVSQNTTGSGVNATTTTQAQTELQWASGPGTVDHYTLQRKQSATWTPVALPSATATTTVEGVSVGSANQYRVRSTTTSGNSSIWHKTSQYGMSVIQDRDARVTYSGTWRTDSSTQSLGGTSKSTAAQGAFAKITFTGRAFAWVGPESAGAGASVYVDGKLMKTVILSGQNQPRRVVFSIAWKAAGAHTIKIVKKYATNRIAVDAFLVLN